MAININFGSGFKKPKMYSTPKNVNTPINIKTEKINFDFTKYETPQERLARLQREEEERKRREEEERKRKSAELQQLYKDLENNNGLLHPYIEADIEKKIRNLEHELNVPHKPDTWESIKNAVGSGASSAWSGISAGVRGFADGFLDVGEGVIDGSIYSIAKPLQLFGVDDAWAENIIAEDYSAKITEKVIGPPPSNHWLYKAGNKVGNYGGYQALSKIPIVGLGVAATGGAGKEVERSINNQRSQNKKVDDWKVFFDSVKGSLEGFAAGSVSKVKWGDKLKSAGGVSGIKSGLGQMFSGGVKQSFKNVVGSAGPVFQGVGSRALKDPSSWADTSANFVDTVSNVMDGNLSVSDVLQFGLPSQSGTHFGVAGLDYFSK